MSVFIGYIVIVAVDTQLNVNITSASATVLLSNFTTLAGVIMVSYFGSVALVELGKQLRPPTETPDAASKSDPSQDQAASKKA